MIGRAGCEIRLATFCLTFGMLVAACDEADGGCPPGYHKARTSCDPDDGGGSTDVNSIVGDGSVEDPWSSWFPDAGEGVRDAAVDGAEGDAAALPERDASVVADAVDGALADAAGSCVPSTEVCNGKDDDCDTVVDEDVSEAPIGAECSVGQGACKSAGRQVCRAGTIVCDAVAGQSAAEVCDSVDNDCDGAVDEEPTEAMFGAACIGGQGACNVPGTYVCSKGMLTCSAPVMPTVELCDGVDNDCKNGVDDTFAMKGMPCTTPVPGDCQGTGVWECDPSDATKMRCTAIEKPKNACGTSCGPVPEENCSTPADDNCNGQANEGCCVPSTEVCDNVDNDCDGKVDEDVSKTWHQDCDGDLYGSTTVFKTACEQPAPEGTCQWIADNRDCNDASIYYNPYANFGWQAPGTAADRNCNTAIEYEGTTVTCTGFQGGYFDPNNDYIAPKAITTTGAQMKVCSTATDCECVEKPSQGFDHCASGSADRYSVVVRYAGTFSGYKCYRSAETAVSCTAAVWCK